MLLTLLPPPSYPIPDTLQTHTLRPPSLPRGVKIPAPYIRAKRSLQDVGIVMPANLCADRAVWWSLAIEEVTWDLESETVEVRFVDGSEERWELDPAIKSSGFVEDSEEEDTPDEAEMDVDVSASSSDASGSPATTGGKGKSPEPRRSSTSVVERLRTLCIQLRDAYEDIGLGAIPINDEQDYLRLLHMAADPSVRAPAEWTNQSLFDFHMRGSSDDECAIETDDSDDEVLVSARVARATTPGLEVDEAGDIHVGPAPTSSPSKKSPTFRGQFKSRRRPLSLDPVASTSTSLPTQPPAPHDYLSFVALLSTVRHTLLDLFSSKIIPKLKERLDTPTYALWAVGNAARWCRRQAILTGGEVARDMMQLLDDDGVTFDASDDDDEDDELEEGEDEDEWALRRGAGGSSPESAGGRRERRLRRNVMYDVMDDYALRMWCEKAQVRAHGMSEDDELQGWSFDRGDDLIASVGAPKFVDGVQPWEVSKPYPTLVGFQPASRIGTQSKKKVTLESLAAALDSSPTKSTLPPTNGDSSAARADALRDLYFGGPGTDASPPLTDCDDDDYFEPGSAQAPEFFCPEDTLGEAFLPPKLPRTLVDAEPFLPLGRDMAKMRERVHEGLNEIAGLQKKIKELQDYLSKHTDEFESARAEERRAKSPDLPDVSRLRHTVETPPSPPRPRTPNTPIPLARQPLRLRAADNSVSAALDQVLGPKKRAAVVAASNAASGKGKGVRLSKQASPRKRARDNLATIERALAKGSGGKGGQSSSSSGKSKKRKIEAGGSAGAGTEDVVAAMRRRKKAKRAKMKSSVVVREDGKDGEAVDEGFAEMSQASTRGASPSTWAAAPVLGSFSLNGTSQRGLSPVPTSAAQKPMARLGRAFSRASSASALAAVGSPPVTPPSSPPASDDMAPSAVPRLTLQELSRQRGPPQALDDRIDEPMIKSGWQDAYRGEDEEGLDGDSDEDSLIEDIILGASEDLYEWEDMELEEVDQEEGAEGDEEFSTSLASMREAIDIPVYDSDSSEDEMEGSTLDVEPGAAPWSTYSSWAPTPPSTTLHADLESMLAPRTPSSFPKSFTSVDSFPSSLPPSPPPSTSAAPQTTVFPTSSERDVFQPATASFIDPTLAALTLDSTSTSANSSSSQQWTSNHSKLWSPVPLRPPFRATSTPIAPLPPMLLDHTLDPASPEPSPAPQLLSPRPKAKGSSTLPALLETDDEGEYEEDASEALEGAEAVKPATARAQAGARFMARMLGGTAGATE